jgi:hypothetical protein
MFATPNAILIRLNYILHRTIVGNQNGKLLFVTTQKQVQQNVKVSFVAFLDNLQKKLINKFSFFTNNMVFLYFHLSVYKSIKI